MTKKHKKGREEIGMALSEEKSVQKKEQEKNDMEQFFELCDAHFNTCTIEECNDLIKQVRQKCK